MVSCRRVPSEDRELTMSGGLEYEQDSPRVSSDGAGHLANGGCKYDAGQPGRNRTIVFRPASSIELPPAPVLQVSELSAPVVLTEMELLRNGHQFLVRVRSKDGGEGLGVPNSMHMVHTYPIFLNRVAPFFLGKDVRHLEPLLWELYRHDDNYKYQGLALWVCVAAAEFAILDLLGKLTGKSVGNLLGGVKRNGDCGLPGQ